MNKHYESQVVTMKMWMYWRIGHIWWGKKTKTIKDKCARKAENEKEPDERSEVKWDKWNISATLKETYKNHTWRKDWRVIFLQWKRKNIANKVCGTHYLECNTTYPLQYLCHNRIVILTGEWKNCRNWDEIHPMSASNWIIYL